tara:strand:+ start:500 stop:607 length:108 start_codon:yes stop_codon:yes gene_type:complete
MPEKKEEEEWKDSLLLGSVVECESLRRTAKQGQQC